MAAREALARAAEVALVEEAERARLHAEAERLRAKVAEDTPEARLVANMASFLRSGGVVSWDRWEGIGPSTKRAFELASRVVERERVQHLATAICARLEPLLRPSGSVVDEAAVLRAAGKMALDEAAGRPPA